MTSHGESSMARPASGKEQSKNRGRDTVNIVRGSHPSKMKGESSIKQKSSATKLSRKELPGRNFRQPVKVAHQKAPTVEVRNESISGIRALQQQAKKRAVEQKFPTFYRVRDPRPPGERRHNSRRSLDMLHRMKITGKNLATAQDSLGLSSF